jgi:WD40 repeat protein
MGTSALRHGSSVYLVAFVDGGKQVLSAGEDGFARLWDVATGREVRHFGPDARCVALSPDGKTLATCDDDLVVLRDTAAGREMRHLKGLKTTLGAPVAALALSPDGKTLAVTGPSGPVVFCDIGGDDGARRAGIRAAGSVPPSTDRADVSLLQSALGRPNGPGGGGQGIWNEKERPHLAFSADGKTLLSATFGYRRRALKTAVSLWDVATGKELRTIEPPGERRLAASAAFSPDARTVALVDQGRRGGGDVHLMEAATAKELHQFACGGTAHMVVNQSGKMLDMYPGVGTRFAFAPDGRTIVTRAEGGQVVVWDVATGKELRRLGERQPPVTWSYWVSSLAPPRLAISPGGKTLAMAGDGNAVTLLDLDTGRQIHPRGALWSAVYAVCYPPDGKALTSLGSDGTVRVWEAVTGKETGRMRLPDGIQTAVLSPDGRTAASAGLDGKVHWSDVLTGRELGTLQTPLTGALRLAFSPDGKTLAAGSAGGPAMWLYDVASAKETRVLSPRGEDEMNPAASVAHYYRVVPPPVFSRDGKRVATPGRAALHVWDAVAGQELQRLPLPEARAVGGAAFAPDGRSVALDMLDGTVVIFEVASGRQRRRFQSGPPIVPVRLGGSLARKGAPLAAVDPALLLFSPDGRLLAHSRGQDVMLWDVGSGQEFCRWEGHGGAVFAGAFTPDGKSLATASADTSVLVWDVTAPPPAAAKSREWTADERTAAWNGLADSDAAKAFDAVLALAAAPGMAVPLLSEHLKPAEAAAAGRVERLVADLNSDQFAVRRAADDELQKLGLLAVPALKKALDGRPGPEASRRIDALLGQASDINLSLESLRLLRAVEALERMRTAEARQLLKTLAAGAPGAMLTETARSSVERLP